MSKTANVKVLDEAPGKQEEDPSDYVYEVRNPDTGMVVYEAQNTKPGQMCALNLVRLPPIPFAIIQWRVAVLVLPPKKKSEGGVLLTRDTQEIDQNATTVGILVARGYHAYKSITRAGINLADEPLNPKLGEYVFFPDHTGVIREFETSQGPLKFRFMAESDILGVTKTPWLFRHYI